MAETRCATWGFVVCGWYDVGAKTNRPTRERRTVLSTPSALNGEEAVDS